MTATSNQNALIGKTFPFVFNHLLQTVTCRLTVVSVVGGVVRARVPKRIMELPFPPFGREHNIALFPVSKIEKIAK